MHKYLCLNIYVIFYTALFNICYYNFRYKTTYFSIIIYLYLDLT